MQNQYKGEFDKCHNPSYRQINDEHYDKILAVDKTEKRVKFIYISVEKEDTKIRSKKSSENFLLNF